MARLDLEDVSTTDRGNDPQAVDDSWLGHLDLASWIDAAEGICLRAGKLKSRLERDDERVVRIMSSLEQDKPHLEITNLWKLELGEGKGDTHMEEGLWAGHPINKPNTKPRHMDTTTTKPLPDCKNQATCVPEGGTSREQT